MEKVSWASLKQFVDARGLSVQYVETSDTYILRAFDAVFSIGCTLIKTLNQEEVADFEANYKANGNQKLDKPITVGSTPAFAAKTTADGKKLFKRVVGIQQACQIGENAFTWTCIFPWAKFMAVELVGGEAGDTVSLFVLDSAAGMVSGVPNYQLNQFGFTANVSKDFYEQRSEFDADIYAGLQIKMVYNSMTAKTIGVNFVMNEVKP